MEARVPMAALSPASRQSRARLAGLRRNGAPDDDPRVVEVRQRLRYERAADHIRAVVDQAPPLTAEQRSRLAILLKGTP
jgi:hypothetical protein